METKIYLSQELDNILSTRNIITFLFEKLNSKKESEIILDFKDIEFISRSAADQYLKERTKSNKKIKEINISKEIYPMFQVVKRQYEKEGYEMEIPTY